MKLKQGLKPILTIFVLAGIGALFVWAFTQGRKELAMEQERERPIKAPLRLSVQDGESVVTLDPTARTKSGIVVAPLEPISRQEARKAYGVVVETQGLIDLRHSYATAKEQVEKTQAALGTSRKAYERLKGLHEENRNISDKTLQAAEGTWRSDQAGAEAARETLRALESSALQQWGEALAKNLFEGTAASKRLVQRQDLLIQITLPPGRPLVSASQTASVQGADGRWTSAHLISPSPRTDPRIQGISFFYFAPAQADLLPGMNILASLPVGPPIEGVAVPDSAVVLWQGKSWVYLQKEADHFVRREIPTETPLREEAALPSRSQGVGESRDEKAGLSKTPFGDIPMEQDKEPPLAKEGWFVTKGLSAGDRLVVSGAQLLFSEEFRAQVQVGEERK